MLPTVRVVPPLVVAAAALLSMASGAALAQADAATEDGPWGDLARFGAAALEASQHVMRWIEASYAKRPAVMIGLAGVLLLPPLMMIGALLYRRRAPRVAPSPDFPGEIGGIEAARFELEGAHAIALPLGRDLVQIGRELDNDICIDDDSLQHYHAVVERSDANGFTITDVSGLEEDGLRINGQRRFSAMLVHGDVVELGRARMRFSVSPHA